MSTSNLHRQVEQRITERDIRYTRGRRAVVAALAATPGPRSAAELSAELGSSVPLSSLYRSLAILEDADVVVPHFASKGLTRYELAEWLTGHHHHLVCIDCGRVEDVDIPPEYETQVEAVIDAVCERAAFSPSSHALEIEGLCSRCAA